MSWRVDGRTFASKVKNPAYGVSQHGGRGRNNECHSCGFVFDDNIRTPEWPGLPAGVKFDPSDQELLEHLAAKVGLNSIESHPFINEFIPTLGQEEGICYTHPERLPGNRSDGSSIHFFHKPAKAYTTGTRKRRKVQLGEDSEHGCDMRWHKTGKTRAILDNGKQLGCKKIMVLYASQGKKGKTEKTNWVMHQYHLGMHEDEREGELVVSKVFYQTQTRHSTAMHQEEGEKTETSVKAWDQDSTFSFLQPSTGNESMLFCPTTSLPFQHVEEAFEQETEAGGLLEHVPPTIPLNLKEKTATRDVCRKELSENVACLNNPDALIAETKLGTSKKIDQAKDAILETETVDQQSCSLKREDVVAQSTDNVKWSDSPCPESYQLSDTLDADLMKLLCNENILKFLKQKSKKHDPAQSLDSEAAGQIGDSTTLDNIMLDTPPEFLSLETLDWLGKRKLWTDSQKVVGSEDGNLNDFLKDTQSSSQFDMS